ncbi:Helix-turn-helix [uncultured Ruminococcus sp.]|nr:Helix-turn-helix [uncultured Clostridium sp.]SCI29619.1 Helix-turn-helix [uncultured Ruminococcus sp.]
MKISSKNLLLAMAKAQIDQKALATKAGLSYPVITRALAGNNTKISSVGKIAAALGVDVAEIVEMGD